MLASRQPYGEWLKREPDHAGRSARSAARLRIRSEDHRPAGSGLSAIPKKICACCWRRWRRMARNRSARWAPIRRWRVCPIDRRLLFHYFKQLFAQVTNPAIDPIREELVMSLTSYIGTERNILEETPQHCHTLKLPHPILTNLDLEKLRRVSWGDFLATTLSAVFRVGRRREGTGARARRPVPPGIARDSRRIPHSDSVRPRRGRRIRADSQPAGADRGAQSPGAGADANSGRADHRIGRAARGDAFRAADRLRRERD